MGALQKSNQIECIARFTKRYLGRYLGSTPYRTIENEFIENIESTQIRCDKMLCKSPCDMSVDILDSQTPLYKVRMLAYVMVEVDTKFKKFILKL